MAIFGSSKKTTLGVGCYGKLPTYGDFITTGADGEEAQQFVGWLEAGVGRFERSGPISDSQFFRFVWFPEGARELIVGVLWPSRDQAGRKFPFALFLRIPAAVAAKYDAFLPVAADGVWSHLLGLNADIRRRGTLDEQYQLVVESKPPALDPPDAVSGVLKGQGFTALNDRRLAGSLGLQMYEVIRYCADLARLPEPREFALRLRLLSASDVGVETACWLKILEKRIGVPGRGYRFFLQVDPVESVSSAFLFHRATAPQDLGFLLVPGEDYAYANSLGFREQPADAQQARFRDRFLRRSGEMSAVWTNLVDLGTMNWTESAAEPRPDPRPRPAAVAAPEARGPASSAPAPAARQAAPVPQAPAPAMAAAAAPGPRPVRSGADGESTRASGLEADFAAAKAAAAGAGPAPVPVPPPPPPPRAPEPEPVTGQGLGPETSEEDDDPDEVLSRLKSALGMPMLPGEVLRAPVVVDVADPVAAAGPRTVDVLLYREEGFDRVLALPPSSPDGDFRAMAGNHRFAKLLLEKISRAHRRREEDLARKLEEQARRCLEVVLKSAGDAVEEPAHGD